MRYLILWIALLSCAVVFAQDNDQHPYCHKPQSLLHKSLFEKADRADDGRIDLIHYDFDWTIDPSIQYIKGIVKITFLSNQDGLTNIRLSLSKNHTIDYIKQGDVVLTFEREGDYDFIINLNGSLSKGAKSSIEIKYEGAPPSGGFGSFETNKHGNNVPVLWTLSEPYGSQDWWPCKNGLTDKLDSIDVHITTQKVNRAASNGKLVSVLDVSEDMHQYNWKHRYPIVPYLVCIGVTNYVEYTDTLTLHDGQPLEMLNYVYPESLTNAKLGTKSLIKVLQWYDSLFYQYPFRKEKYGHAEFGWGGGEEHQTMTFVTNFDIGLLSHELAHQWFGDMVTCGSWEDIWLNEGFATYLEGIMREKFIPSTWNSWKEGKLNNITSQPGGSVFVTDTTNVNRIFSGRLTYNKGGYVLHMLRWVLGDDNFFKGIRSYIEDRKYNYAKTAQLQEHLEKVSGMDLDEFFKDWFTGQGYPSYTIDWMPSDVFNYIELKISQKTSSPAVDFFKLPLPILFKGDGIDSLVRLNHTFNGETYLINIPFEVKSVEFDPALWLISKDNKVNRLPTGTHIVENSSLSIFPSAATSFLTVKNATADMKYTIVQMDGKTVGNGVLSNGTSQINVQHLLSGSYTIFIEESGIKLKQQLFTKIN